MATLYHIYVSPKAGVTNEQIEKKMDLALDWYKYGNNCWIVKSTSEPSKWQTRLKPLVEPSGTLFICKLDVTQRQGWMPKKFWEWLKSDA
jgi:hypothetical protein